MTTIDTDRRQHELEQPDPVDAPEHPGLARRSRQEQQLAVRRPDGALLMMTMAFAFSRSNTTVVYGGGGGWHHHGWGFRVW